jgi:site-specific recombinase XerC
VGAVGEDDRGGVCRPRRRKRFTSRRRRWQRRVGELQRKTQQDYRWRLDHLLRELAHEPTSSIDTRRVDSLRQALVGRGLGPRSVNMVLACLRRCLTTLLTTACWMPTRRAAGADG